MSIGIYKLNFPNTAMCYIGQSADSIERRFTNHLRSMRNRFTSIKLQEAYDTYGEPSLEILIEALPEDLDSLEIEAIDVYNSIKFGFNTMSGGSTGNGQFGETASNALYDNIIYINILKMCSLGGYSTSEIASELKVSKVVVASVRNCSNHKWLKEALPEEYAIVEKRHKDYSHKNNNTAESRGITYPALINIATGTKVIVTSLRETARNLGMDSSNLDQLLHGKLHSCKGYATELSIHKLKSRYIESPTGEIHEIPYLGASSFARKHNLTSGKLSEVLTNTIPQYKGWKLPCDDRRVP